MAQPQGLPDYSGVAPVTKPSGQQRTVHCRWVRPKFLHQTLVEFASCSIGQCEWTALLYQDLCARGHSKWRAIRVLACQWLRILWRCWKDQVAYDETRYRAASKNAGSNSTNRSTPNSRRPRLNPVNNS